jgi:PAS domain S-box-containing protein
MNIKRNIKFIMILNLSVIIFIIFLLNSFLFAQENPTKNILILNSYHKGFLWTDNIVKGIESVLEPEKNNIKLSVEYMDTKTTGYETEYKKQLYDLYKYKYKNRKFDLIISSDDNALDFLREFHQDLFPEVPIVFCGVNNLNISNTIDREMFTGIVELHSVKETIDLALRLHPGTKQIVFVVENSPTGTYLWNQIKGLLKYYEDIGTTRIDDSLSMQQIEDKVSKLSDDVIVYWGTFHRDKFRKYYSFEEGASRVSKASSRPMYGHSVQILPYGIVGGKLLGGFYHGQIVAEMAQRILMGEKALDISVLTEPQTQYMFNYEQMQRFGINISDLPEGSIVINKPSSFYEENKILIWGVIVFVALQMLIIISLVMSITKRKKAEEGLTESLQRERFWADIVRNASVGVAIGYPDGRLGMCNVAYQKITGYSEKELQTIAWNKILTPREWEESETDKLQELHRTKKSVQYEKEYIRKDGSRVPVELLVHPRFDSDGNVECYFAFVIDITERKKTDEELQKHREHLEELINERTVELEEKTKKIEESQQALTYLLEDVNESRAELDVLNKQLQAANKELEAFAYSVSHDLRAPLRNIDGFSQILLEDYSDILDKQGQHYLQRVRAGTQNMGQLIDDILSLSRSGRHTMDKKTINIESIVREVYNSLENELKDRKVDFVVHECPPALADSHLVKIVFTNLLTNALKFTRIRENAKIETGFMTENGHTVFFIKDNGAGFDMKYADKLFIPFQRLHRAEEFEGSGIGLAIVQRIIHRHGGRIWAESKINVGTTFYFTFSV